MTVTVSVLVFRSPLSYLTMTPKHTRSDAGNSYMPKRIHKVLPLSERVKVLDLVRRGKKSYAEVDTIFSKNK